MSPHTTTAFVVQLRGKYPYFALTPRTSAHTAFGGRSCIRSRGARQGKVCSQGFGVSEARDVSGEREAKRSGAGAVVKSGCFCIIHSVDCSLRKLQSRSGKVDVGGLCPRRERTQTDPRWVGPPRKGAPLFVTWLILFLPPFYFLNQHFGEKKQL